MPNTILAQKELKELLHYNPETGVFTWLKVHAKTRTAKVGGIAGCLHSAGYIMIGIKGTNYYAHRLAWLITYGDWPKEQIDHQDHNRSNNMISNLREATRQENARNQSLSRANKSGVCGVIWYKPTNKWMANIKENGKLVNLGYFYDFFEACCARKSAENKYCYHENHGR